MFDHKSSSMKLIITIISFLVFVNFFACGYPSCNQTGNISSSDLNSSIGVKYLLTWGGACGRELDPTGLVCALNLVEFNKFKTDVSDNSLFRFSIDYMPCQYLFHLLE